FHLCALALNGAGLNVSRHPQTLGVGGIAHGAQFLDGDVIALALLDAGVRQITEREQNRYDGPAELQVLAGLTRHKPHALTKLYASCLPRSSAGRRSAAPRA